MSAVHRQVFQTLTNSQRDLEVVLGPGLSPKVVAGAIIQSECKALVIRSYGPGNVTPWYEPLIKHVATEANYPVFISSQCAGSGISAGESTYAIAKGVIRAGAVPIGDMSPTATTVKLMNVMPRFADLMAIRREMISTSYAGEISLGK